jgi:hypothetical protein
MLLVTSRAAASEGFALRLLNSERSRHAGVWPAEVSFVKHKLSRRHAQNRDHVHADLKVARRVEGAALFELIIGIIRGHVDGGVESQSNVVIWLASIFPFGQYRDLAGSLAPVGACLGTISLGFFRSGARSLSRTSHPANRLRQAELDHSVLELSSLSEHGPSYLTDRGLAWPRPPSNRHRSA